MGIVKRLLFIPVAIIYFISIFTCLGPLLYWIITGNDFEDFFRLLHRYMDWMDV